jgi:hypothetical protein
MTSRWATAQTRPVAGWGPPRAAPTGSYPGTRPAPKIVSTAEPALTDALTEASS